MPPSAMFIGTLAMEMRFLSNKLKTAGFTEEAADLEPIIVKLVGMGLEQYRKEKEADP